MITNFEEYTEKLGKFETHCKAIVIEQLKARKGQRMAVTGKYLRGYLKRRTGRNVSGARMRKIINNIRMTGAIHNLIATNKGYYRCEDEEELNNYIRSLRERADSINALADRMRIGMTSIYNQTAY